MEHSRHRIVNGRILKDELEDIYKLPSGGVSRVSHITPPRNITRYSTAAVDKISAGKPVLEGYCLFRAEDADMDPFLGASIDELMGSNGSGPVRSFGDFVAPTDLTVYVEADLSPEERILWRNAVDGVYRTNPFKSSHSGEHNMRNY